MHEQYDADARIEGIYDASLSDPARGEQRRRGTGQGVRGQPYWVEAVPRAHLASRTEARGVGGAFGGGGDGIDPMVAPGVSI